MYYLLPPDDLPPETTTEIDKELTKQLERSLCQHFFESCDGSTQSLLMLCKWNMAVAEVLILNIDCSDQEKSWRVLNRMATLAKYLSKFSASAKIRVYSPSEQGSPLDMRVDEHSV